MLRRLLLVVAGLAAALFFLPFAWARRVPRGPGFWTGSGYFACIGVAYMLVQAPWIQRFVLYLGHPSRSTTVVLAAMLVGTGAGALTAGRVAPRMAGGVLAALPVAVAAANLAAGHLFDATLGAPLAARVVAASAIIAPSGFLMGFAFPTGVARFGHASLAWFWAVNGFAGVLASVASLALSMAFGLTAVAYAGALFYVASVLLLAGAPRAAAEGTHA
jgi:hypothetical protein